MTIVIYSGPSLLRSPTGLGKSDLNGEETLLQGSVVLFFALEYSLGLSKGDRNAGLTILLR